MRCLIVDDEPLSRKAIAAQLAQYAAQGFTVAGEASGVEEAYELVRRESPDLVFLDIRMPGGDGFSLLERFDPLPFRVVFITAYADMSIRALRQGAFDYLLKPVNEQDFDQMIARLQKEQEKNPAVLPMEALRHLLRDIQVQPVSEKIIIPHSKGYRLAAPEEIIRMEGDHGYTTFFFTDSTRLVVSKNLKDFQGELDERVFIRVHKSHIVNRKYIREYITRDGGYMVMTDGAMVPAVKKNLGNLFES